VVSATRAVTGSGPGHRLPMTVRDGWALLEAVADLPDLGPTPVELMVDLGSRGNVLFTTPFVRRYRLDRPGPRGPERTGGG